MKILLISYGDIDFDGRLRSLISVFSKIGEVRSLTRGRHPFNDISQTTNSAYSKFILEAIRFAKHVGEVDLLVLDNRKATIPGRIIQMLNKPHYTIQDCRELYLFNEVRHLTGRIGCIFERMMARKADIVICANQERCTIMQKTYKLKRAPIPYENLRSLKYESEESLIKAKRRLDSYIHKGEYRIVSSSGCSVERTNDILVKNIKRVDKKCRLFLVGDSTGKDKKIIESIINRKQLKNIVILGRLDQTELKYLISRCHLGIVNYGQYDTNNKYCASGKLYEFLYEGLPVVTTTNPPLKRLCDKYGIGVADDAYYIGINHIVEDYHQYKERVASFVENNTVIDNDNKLLTTILERLNRDSNHKRN